MTTRDRGRRTDESPGTVTVRLFDADATDTTPDLGPALRRRLRTRQLLWIDIEGRVDPSTADALARRMHLAPGTRRALVEPVDEPAVLLHGGYFHLRIATASDDGPRGGACWLDLVVSRPIVISVHREPMDALRHVDARNEGDGAVGALDGAAFARSVLDAIVTGYLRAVDAIEDEVDELDGRALRSAGGEDLVASLVALRRRIARLRRSLSNQREVFATLRTADFEAASAEDDAAGFQAVADRYEAALRSIEDSRELLIGSFDVFMTRTAQRTNEIMKALALATVLLLPGSLIAGLLGMNVEVPLPKDGPSSFWLVVVAIAALAAIVLLVARLRRWV